jgi:hypothetical protein
VRVPMLVRVPWIKESHGKHSDALIELVVRQQTPPARPPAMCPFLLPVYQRLPHDPLPTRDCCL